MGTSRRWGIGLTVVAALLWVVIVVAVITTRPEDGANIGAGMLFFLAVPCTITGVALLAADRRAGQEPAPGIPAPGSSSGGAAARQPTGSDTQNNPVASWALALGIVGVVLSLAPIGATEAAYWIGLAVAFVVCLVATLLGWLGLRRARARGGVNRSLALAGTIVGTTGLGLNLFLIPELILFLTGHL